MRFARSSGILLHPTSLPGPWGIGDLGENAYRFVDFLAAAGQRLWQILPLGPTGYGDSPYQCFSTMAGNPLLVSPDRLVADGLLDRATLERIAAPYRPAFSESSVAYGAVISFKAELLRASFAHFRTSAPATQVEAYAQFCTEQSTWLNDYAFFMALKQQHEGASWHTWERELATRQGGALHHWGEQLAEQIEFEKYRQYLFFSQWLPLKAYANKYEIKIIGDAPIFVAYDSADVWANPQLFFLDEQGRPTVVAGVPPDYFSATGQLWGNPLYRWERMAERGFAWWTNRVRTALQVYDILRLDHFRGFAAYWEVPADEETAVNGRWVPAPGTALFETIERELGDLPLIAEDLGLITPDVNELRERFSLPGMRVLQFAFDGKSDNLYLPHNYDQNSVVYTGTHDNDTTIGWFTSLSHQEREVVRRYLGHGANDIAWDLIRLALSSVAALAVIPLQDVLRLGSAARMNTPGVAGGNWSWRFREGMLSQGLATGLKLLTETYGRGPLPEEEPASE